MRFDPTTTTRLDSTEEELFWDFFETRNSSMLSFSISTTTTTSTNTNGILPVPVKIKNRKSEFSKQKKLIENRERDREKKISRKSQTKNSYIHFVKRNGLKVGQFQ